MVLNLRVRPLGGKTKREVVLPKAARPVVRPQPSVTKALRAVMRPQPAVPLVAPQPLRRPPVMPKRGVAAKQQPGKVNKPTVKVVTRDPPEASTRKLRELRNSGTGRILVIIANGPSVLEVDTARLLLNPRVDIMSINKPDSRVWPTKYWLFCDISQLKRHNDLWSKYNGYIFNSTMIQEVRPGTIFIKNIPGFGFSTDLASGFHIGRSSVYAAMQVALWLGYDKIYIFGIDMGAVIVDGKEMLHFYGQNLDCTADSRKKRFIEEARYYEDAGRTLPPEIRDKFYFCSSYNRFDFINRFNKLDHREAIDIITNDV